MFGRACIFGRLPISETRRLISSLSLLCVFLSLLFPAEVGAQDIDVKGGFFEQRSQQKSETPKGRQAQVGGKESTDPSAATGALAAQMLEKRGYEKEADRLLDEIFSKVPPVYRQSYDSDLKKEGEKKRSGAEENEEVKRRVEEIRRQGKLLIKQKQQEYQNLSARDKDELAEKAFPRLKERKQRYSARAKNTGLLAAKGEESEPAVLSLIIDLDPMQQAEKAVERALEIASRTNAALGQVVIVGLHASTQQTMEKMRQSTPVIKKGEIRPEDVRVEEPFFYKLWRVYHLGASGTLDLAQLMDRLKVKTSPTWVVRFKGVDHVFEGWEKPESFFTQDGTFTAEDSLVAASGQEKNKGAEGVQRRKTVGGYDLVSLEKDTAPLVYHPAAPGRHSFSKTSGKEQVFR